MNSRNTTKLGLALAVSITLPQLVNAQGVAPPLGGSTTQLVPGGAPYGDITLQGGRTVVTLDPAGDPWYKELRAAQYGLGPWTPGSGMMLYEPMTIGGNLPWSDYHIRVLTPGFGLRPYFPQSPGFYGPGLAGAAGYSDIVTPATPTTGGSIDMFFDPIAPGSDVFVQLWLEWLGPDTIPAPQVIRFAQYPTPEPASMALLALGGLVLMRRRRSASSL